MSTKSQRAHRCIKPCRLAYTYMGGSDAGRTVRGLNTSKTGENCGYRHVHLIARRYHYAVNKLAIDARCWSIGQSHLKYLLTYCFILAVWKRAQTIECYRQHVAHDYRMIQCDLRRPVFTKVNQKKYQVGDRDEAQVYNVSIHGAMH